MKDRHLALVRTLLESEGWLTSSELGMRLSLSERSVKNHVNEICSYEKNLVESSRKGYRIDRERASRILEESKVHVPDTPDSRVRYIMNLILSGEADSARGMDLNDIADRLFVSSETVRKDISKIRKVFSDFDLFINLNGTFITVTGKEVDKRRLLGSILYEEFDRNILSLEVVQTAFPGYDLGMLKGIITDVCREHHYFINDYSLMNLVLDIIISIDRIRRHSPYRTHYPEKRDCSLREMELTENIAREIESRFGISYSDIELEELSVTLISHLMRVDYNVINTDNIVDFIGKECWTLVSDLIANLGESYFFDKLNDDFLIKFMLHVRNLLIRLENNTTARNPLTSHIKNTCPLIFESAVSIAYQIKNLTGYYVSEDEIAYLALHVGVALESNQNLSSRTSCVLLFPQYYDFGTHLLDRLKSGFEDRISVRSVATSEGELSDVREDELVITTAPLRGQHSFENVTVSPFFTANDMAQVEHRLAMLKLTKKKKRLMGQLKWIADPRLFEKNPGLQTREETIPHMTGILQELGYVDGKYITDVLEREKDSPTAFGQLAVPHSFRMNAVRTGMSVLLSDKPIDWGGQMVNVVLMFAVNKEERGIFHNIFDNLIVLLLENRNLSRALKSADYDEFIENIIECVES